MCGRRVNREIDDGQAGSPRRLRVHPQQDLVRKLIPGGCRRLPDGQVPDIALSVIRDTDRPHRFSSPSSPNLVSGQNKGVLRTISIEAEANHLDRSATHNGRELERTHTLSGQASAGILPLASEIRDGA
jgi:hypothetical protein